MKRYTPFVLFLFLITVFSLSAQQRPGSLRGTVTESENNECVPFANVTLMDTLGNEVTGTSTDFEGKFNINPIAAGVYDVEVSFIGYKKLKMTGIVIMPNTPTFQDFKLEFTSSELNEVEIYYSAPLIDKTKGSNVTTSESIRNMPLRDITSVASQAVSVNHRSTGNTEVRITRGEGTIYYIDGVKVRGNVSLPQAAIAQTEVITGGLPAQYESYDQVPTEVERLEAPHSNEPQIDPREAYSGENYKSIPENEFLGTFHSPLSTFGSDVDVASYANARRMLKDGNLPHPDAVRLEEFINYFQYDYPEPEGDDVFAVKLDQRTCDWNPKHQLLRIGLQTKKMKADQLPPSNLVFLIDVSGSMNSHDKLPLLQKAMRIMVKNLKPEDRVAIVVYASATGLVLNSTSASDSRKILKAIDGLQAGGSTAGGAGIKRAYKEARKHFNPKHNNRVILATDGDFNVGVSSEADLISLIEEEREDGIFLSVLGFGTGNFQDAKMEALADHGNGNYAYIDGLLEARKVLAEELGANFHVVAKDTKFQIEFNPAKVAAYRLLGYENRLLADEDFDDDLKDAGDIGAGHSVTVVYELIMRDDSEDTLWSKKQKSLRYQDEVLKDQAYGDELAQLKIRYKEPLAKKSQLQVIPVKQKFSNDSDFAFLSAVIQYGLLLRESEYSGVANLKSVIALAKENLGEDQQGYRREFIQLCKLARDLQ